MLCFLLGTVTLLLLASVANSAFHMENVALRQSSNKKTRAYSNFRGFLDYQHFTQTVEPFIKKKEGNSFNPALSEEQQPGISSWTFPVFRESDLKNQEEKLEQELRSLYIQAGYLKHELEESYGGSRSGAEVFQPPAADSATKISEEAVRIGLENAAKAEVQTHEMQAEEKVLEDKVHRQEEAEDAEAMRERSKRQAKEKILREQENRDEMAETAHELVQKAAEEAKSDLELDPAIENALKDKEKKKAERALLEEAEEAEAASVVAEHNHQLTRNAEAEAMRKKEEAIAMASDTQHAEQKAQKKNEQIENAWQAKINKRIRQIEDKEACKEEKTIKAYDQEIKTDCSPCAANFPDKSKYPAEAPPLAAKFEHPEKFHLNKSAIANTEQPSIIIIPAARASSNVHASPEHKMEATIRPTPQQNVPVATESPMHEAAPVVVVPPKQEKLPVVEQPTPKKKSVVQERQNKEKVPIVEEPHSQEKMPVVEESPKQEKTPIIEEPSKPEKKPVIEEPTKQEKVPVTEEPPKQEKAPIIEKPPKQEKVPVIEEPPKQEKVPVIEEPPKQEKEPDIEEPHKQEKLPVATEPPKHEEASTAEHENNEKKEKSMFDSPTLMWVYVFIIFPVCIALVLLSLLFFT